MIPTLVFAFLVGWPQPGPARSAAPASSYHWVQPSPNPNGQSWPFYGDPMVGPREVVCLRPEWLYIGVYRGAAVRGWYPGTCWSRRIYRRYVY